MTPASREPAWPAWLGAGALPAGYRLEQLDRWIAATRRPDGAEPRPAQGWKLHVAARPGSLQRTAAAAVPVLLAEGCDFKVVADASVLSAFNQGLCGVGAVGKAITVYPRQHRVQAVARRLADALAGLEAPRVRSDRRVRPDAPVYYRYGPFSPRLRIDDSGHVDITVEGPDGTRESGVAGGAYSAPAWADDPFRRAPGHGALLPRAQGAPVIGDHYRLASVIARGVSGATCRAVDARTGLPVVIKGANAFVNETAAGDARSYLRHERRVLGALSGIEQVPEVVDHFAYGPDEYLVTTDLGPRDLRGDVVEHGVFDCSGAAGRSAVALARSILRALDAIHRRGVVYRDLAPQNVVVMADGRWGLVDFELGRIGGVQRFGWTPGYSCPGQRENRPARRGDDYYSLGALLFYAVMGMDPVVIDADPLVNAARTMSCLAAAHGGRSRLAAVVGGLLSADPGARVRAARRLREAEDLGGVARPATARPARPAGPDLPAAPPLGPLLETTLDAVTRLADRTLASMSRGPLPPSVVPQVGSAGLVAELALHPRGASRAAALAAETARIAQRVEAPAGLLYGRMGVALALRAAASAAGDPSLRRAAARVAPGRADLDGDIGFDVAHGLAGLGIGFLALAASAQRPGTMMALADECAGRLVSGRDRVDAQFGRLPGGNPAHGVSIADGFAHGRAGVAYFLLAHAARSGDARSRERARAMMEELAAAVPGLVALTGSPRARPMAGSWCQGLAGIGAALARGACFFSEESYLAAARAAARGCLALAPRAPLVTQCCGLAGAGELCLDLFLVTGERSHRRDALQVLRLMLARSGGTARAPRFPGSSLTDDGIGWGDGAAGVLAFLRRLRDPVSGRHWMADDARILAASPGLSAGPALRPSG